MYWTYFGLVFFCLAGSVGAAPTFRVEKDYPELGLRFRTLGGSVPEPLAQCQTYTYTFTRDNEQFKRDLFDVRELWYATQHVGQWRDRAGNVMILARVTRQLPLIPSAMRHVAREDFDAALADPALIVDADNKESITKWVKDFADCKLLEPEALRTGFNLHSAWFYSAESMDQLIYLFRFKGRTPQGQVLPSDLFCVLIQVNDGTLIAKVRKDFETQFLAQVSGLNRLGGAVSSNLAAQALNKKVLNVQSGETQMTNDPVRVATRARIANMQGWWLAETSDYLFISDIRSAQGKALVRELQETLPVLRRAFTKLIPPIELKQEVNVVRIYEAREAYQQYVGKEMAWSCGLWDPMRRELVILAQGKDREQTLEIIYHEGFHQYLFYASGMVPHAIWYNEGHACLFESAEVDNRGRVTIPENTRVTHLLRNLESVAGMLPKVLQADRSAFYSGAEQQRDLNYTAAWALVYFLQKGAPSEKLTEYAGILERYLKSLALSKDSSVATAAGFAEVDMQKFQQAFIDFWRKGRQAGQRFDPL